MDNLLPEFRCIQTEAPLKTQSLAHFDLNHSYSHDEISFRDLNAKSANSLSSWIRETHDEDNDENVTSTVITTSLREPRILYPSTAIRQQKNRVDCVSSETNERTSNLSSKRKRRNKNVIKKNNEMISLNFFNLIRYRPFVLSTRMIFNVDNEYCSDNRYNFYVQDEDNKIDSFEVENGMRLSLLAGTKKNGRDNSDLESEKGVTISLLSDIFFKDGSKRISNNLDDEHGNFSCRNSRQKQNNSHLTIRIPMKKSTDLIGIEVEEKANEDGSTFVFVKRVIEGSEASTHPEIQAGCVLVRIARYRVTSLSDLSITMQSIAKGNADSIDLDFVTPKEYFFLTEGHFDQDVCIDNEDVLSNIPTLPTNVEKSVDDTHSIILSFQNNHSFLIMKVGWLNYDGEFVPRKELNPGESYMERSYATHPWICGVYKNETLPNENDCNGIRNSCYSLPSMSLCLGENASKTRKRFNVLWDPIKKSISMTTKTCLTNGFEKIHYIFEDDVNSLQEEGETVQNDCLDKSIQRCLPKMSIHLIG